jgi:hypothetical protein
MKIRITAEYEVAQDENTGMFEILDDSGICLTRHEELGPAMNSLAGMIENEMLDPSVFEIEVINVVGGTA